MNSKEISVHISTGTVFKSILVILLFAFLFFLRDLVLVVLTAVVIAAAIEPAAKWIMRFKIPRIIAVVLVYVVIGVVFFGIFYLFIPPLLNEAENFLAILPSYVDSLDFSNGLVNPSLIESSQVATEKFSIQESISQLQGVITGASGGVVSIVSIVFGGVLSFILIIVFSFYFAAQERGIDDFLKVVTPTKHQKYILDLWRRTQKKIGRWMQGQLLLGFLIGVLVYLGLTVLGVKYAFLLAVLAALFELIPVFGPILAAIPAIAVGFIVGGAQLGLLVAGLYIIIQQFENHLIYPLVVTKVVGVPPLLVILALIVGAQLAGFLGIILSVPVAAAIQELTRDIQKGRETLLNGEKKKAH